MGRSLKYNKAKEVIKASTDSGHPNPDPEYQILPSNGRKGQPRIHEQVESSRNCESKACLVSPFMLEMQTKSLWSVAGPKKKCKTLPEK
jgi:hypothetical protein